MKILMTGGTGFIGSRLMQYLIDSGHTVCNIVKKKLGETKPDQRCNCIEFESLTTNFFDLIIDYQPDCTVHLAAYHGNDHQDSEMDRMIDANIRFGSHLLRGVIASGCKNFIQIGTYWQNYQGKTYSPRNFYAATKQAMEEIMRLYTDRDGLNCVTLRLFDTYGKGDSRNKLINQLIQSYHTGVPLEVSPGQQEVGFVHVDDVCEGIWTAIKLITKEDGTKSTHIFCLNPDEIMLLKDFIVYIEQLVGRKNLAVIGAREYRQREIMNLPRNVPRLINWKPRIGLDVGIPKCFEITSDLRN